MTPCEPGACIPQDDPPTFGHRAPCPECPHVRCARCGTLATIVDAAELVEAWDAMLRGRPVKGQTSWL